MYGIRIVGTDEVELRCICCGLAGSIALQEGRKLANLLVEGSVVVSITSHTGFQLVTHSGKGLLLVRHTVFHFHLEYSCWCVFYKCFQHICFARRYATLTHYAKT